VGDGGESRAFPPDRLPFGLGLLRGIRHRGLLVGRGRETNLPGARQDGVFEVAAGLGVDRRVDPLAAAVAGLAEHGDAHAVGAQLTIEDEDIDLETLVGRAARAVPIGDDGAAERIGINDMVSSEACHRKELTATPETPPPPPSPFLLSPNSDVRTLKLLSSADSCLL